MPGGGPVYSGAPPPQTPLETFGWVDLGATSTDVAVLGICGLVGLAACGAVRVRRRPLPAFAWIGLGAVPQLLCTPGPAVTGFSTALVGLGGYSAMLMWLGQRIRSGRPWGWLLGLGLGAWLAVSGLPWVSIGLTGGIGAVLMSRRGSSTLRDGPMLMAVIAVASLVAIAQRSAMGNGTTSLWLPLFGTWRWGAAALLGMGLACVRATPRALVGVMVGALCIVHWPPEERLLTAPPPWLHYRGSMFDTQEATARRPSDPATDLVPGERILVMFEMPGIYRARLGTLEILAWDPRLPTWMEERSHRDAWIYRKHSILEGPRELSGSVRDVISGCPNPCYVVAP